MKINTFVYLALLGLITYAKAEGEEVKPEDGEKEPEDGANPDELPKEPVEPEIVPSGDIEVVDGEPIPWYWNAAEAMVSE